MPKPTTAPPKIRPGDGFDIDEPGNVSADCQKYTATAISSLTLGMAHVSVTGRVVGWDEVQMQSKNADAAKVQLKLFIKDDTGVVEVRSSCP